MKIAFIIYDGMTTLDFIGAYDPITRLKTMGFINNLEYDVCSNKSRIISAEGLEVTADNTLNNLSTYDFIVVPGGVGVKNIVKNEEFIQWIKTAQYKSTITSVCGGSIILGLAGLIKDKKATTHPMRMEYLKKFTSYATDKRIIEDGNIITARGVTSSIDLGLFLCEKIAGKETREKIQKQMDYPNYNYD
ncbi:DJ-1/PfpI family protein [Methanobacterium sp.]|uniref:DJ-1/PfpI family protein n=1 Tax=Methanobacterium sp. TaxID=2164 RepID=UPI003C78F69D